jgi:hypothetical protein
MGSQQERRGGERGAGGGRCSSLGFEPARAHVGVQGFVLRPPRLLQMRHEGTRGPSLLPLGLQELRFQLGRLRLPQLQGLTPPDQSLRSLAQGGIALGQDSRVHPSLGELLGEPGVGGSQLLDSGVLPLALARLVALGYDLPRALPPTAEFRELGLSLGELVGELGVCGGQLLDSLGALLEVWGPLEGLALVALSLWIRVRVRVRRSSPW